MMEDPVLVAAALVTVSGLWVWWQWYRRHLETKTPIPGVPMPEGSHWFFGHVSKLLDSNFSNTMTFFKAFANDYGQVGVWARKRRVLYVFDIKDARTVLNKESYRFRAKLLDRHTAKVTGKRGLLALNGKDWRMHRLAVTKTFNPDFLDGTRHDMKEVTERMVKNIQKKVTRLSTNGSSAELDVEPMMKTITLGIFNKTALNIDEMSSDDDLNPSPLASAFDYLSEQFMKRIRRPFLPQHFFYWIPTEQNRQQLKKHQMLRSFLADLITEKRKRIEQNPNRVTGKDLMTHLLKAHNDVQSMGIVEPDEINDDSLTDIVMTLFVAGYDTTSITLACCLYLLAQKPQAQEHCVREIRNAKGNLTEPKDLVYCKAAIWEALRMYPPATATLRTTSKPMELSGGLIVPEGVDIFVPIYAFHYDEKLFARPQEFLPERWVAPQEGKEGQWMEREPGDSAGDIPAANRANMMAFSAGGRNCVGYKFATQEAVLVLANLLNGLEFEAAPGFELKTSTKGVLNKPDNGVPLIVSARASVSAN